MKKKNILEYSLSRIWKDFQNTEFAIITSWRVGDSDNKKNLSELKSAIQSAGFGYVRIDGVGQEEVNGNIVRVKEPSLLVKNSKSGSNQAVDSQKFYDFMVSLGRKYKQWGIVYNNPTRGTQLIALKDDDGNPISPKVVMKMSKFNPMKTAQFFSSLKGKPFTFEGFKYTDPPQNWIHGMNLQGEGQEDIYRYETYEKWMESMNNLISIEESSLSRVWKQVTEHDSGTISAFRSARDCGNGEKYSKNENMKRSTVLKSKLLSMGYGVTRIDGVYIENYGKPNQIPVKEVSFLVVDIKNSGNLKKDLIKLGTYFEQDSITYSKPNGDYYIISSNKCPDGYPGNGKIGLEKKLGKPFFSKSGEFHSRVNGRPFVFENINKNLKVLTDYSVNEIQSFVMRAKEINI